MIEHRDRDGELIKLEFEGYEIMPPPSSEKYANRLHYENKQLVDIVNELLDRVHQLEELRKQEMLSHVPKPSVEY